MTTAREWALSSCQQCTHPEGEHRTACRVTICPCRRFHPSVYRLETDLAERDRALGALRVAAAHPHKGEAFTDSKMLLEAAHRIEERYPPGGQHTTAMVVRVLRAVAELVKE